MCNSLPKFIEAVLMIQPIIMKTQPTTMQGLRPNRSVIVGLDFSISHPATHWLLRMHAKTYTMNMERMEPMVNMLVKRPRRLDLEWSVPTSLK